MNARDALAKLHEGNRRFASGRPSRPNQDAARRRALLGGQQPFATVLTCADSRVVPAIIFDCGLGDLFEIHVAGNVVTHSAVASVEFAVESLGCELCLILGHSDCGAVKAAANGDRPPGELGRLIAGIAPICSRSADLDAAIRANVEHQVRSLSSSDPVLRSAIGDRRLTVLGAVYDLDSGTVDLLD